MYDRKLSNAEQAVQRKVQSGKNLTSDDRRIVQTRLRAMQKRGDLDGMTGVGVPSNATHVVPMPLAGTVWRAVNAEGATMFPDSEAPDFSGTAGQIEAPMRQMNGGNATASANGIQVTTHWRGAPVLWTLNVTYKLGTIHWNKDGGGAGTMSGSQNTGGGNAGGQTAASGAGGGASGTYSGVNAAGSASAGGANSNAQSTQGTAGQGGTASANFDSYTAPLLCDWHLDVRMDTTWNPLSWLSSGGKGSRQGTDVACGRYNFQMPA